MNLEVQRMQCPHCRASQSTKQEECSRCAFPLALVDERYQLLRHLEKGGTGILYLALDTYEQCEVVLKVLCAEVVRKNRNAPIRFQREILATELLSGSSRHAVQFHGAGEDPVVGSYMVLEYLRGRTLRALLDARPIAMPVLAYHIFFQLCEVLSDAHVLGYIHRDLKPDNIFVIEKSGDPNFVKLLDFGLVKSMAQTDSPRLTKGLLGSPLYMAPEQTCTDEIDERTDVYALGLVMYEMLTGSPTFGGRNIDEVLEAQMFHQPQPLKCRRPDLHFPEGLEEVLFMAIAKQPKERYDSIQEFAQHIAEYAPYDNERWMPHPTTSPTTAERAKHRTSQHMQELRTTLDLPLSTLHRETPSKSMAILRNPHKTPAPMGRPYKELLSTKNKVAPAQPLATPKPPPAHMSSFWTGLFLGLMLMSGALLYIVLSM